METTESSTKPNSSDHSSDPNPEQSAKRNAERQKKAVRTILGREASETCIGEGEGFHNLSAFSARSRRPSSGSFSSSLLALDIHTSIDPNKDISRRNSHAFLSRSNQNLLEQDPSAVLEFLYQLKNEAAVQRAASRCSVESKVVYKDMSTWTQEDEDVIMYRGNTSPLSESSVTIDSPTENIFTPQVLDQIAAISFAGKGRKRGRKSEGKTELLLAPQKAINSPYQVECYSVSAQLMDRESRLYENTPKTQRELENMEILLRERNALRALHSANNSHSNLHGNMENLFSVTADYLSKGGRETGGNVGPPSWGDSGRESLSFDGENNIMMGNPGSGSSRNLLLLPPPPPPANFANNSFGGNNNGGSGSSNSSSRRRRERLTRQKTPIQDTDSLNYHMHQASKYLAVPSPRRNTTAIGPSNNGGFMVPSPISLQRHPPAQQLMLQENKRSRPLIPYESPYGEHHGGIPGGYNDGRYALGTRSPHRVAGHVGSRIGARMKNHNQSFDYGELPSHQMFPKRHLLGGRQFNGTHAPPSGGNLASMLVMQQQQKENHRSIPASLFR